MGSAIKVKTSYFVAESNGKKRTYSFADRVKGYHSVRIPSPGQVSFINFYINGVLQPKTVYRVCKGKLLIRARDIPPKGTPLLLQFMAWVPKKNCNPKRPSKKKWKKGRCHMAAPYLKLFLTATNTFGGSVDVSTTTDVATNVLRYSASVILSMVVGGVTTIPATSFVDDNGDPVSAGGLTVPTDGFFNVYINGVLQHGGLSSLTANNLVINTSVVLGVTVVLEVEDFAGTTSASTATNNLTLSTTINT